MKTKDKEMKGVSASAAVTGLFGITEPAIYGVNLRLKKPMICGCIAGAVGGAIAGAFHAVSWGYNMPGIATIPAYFKAGHMGEFFGFLISIAVSFVLGVILTCVVGFEEDVQEQVEEEVKVETQNEPMNAECSDSMSGDFELACPVRGRVIPLTEVADEMFATSAMGDGVGIVPFDGQVYAPCDGIAEVVFPTGHAIGISENGVDVLIHIGINTVELEGNGFKAHVQQGDKIKKGDLLVSFDKDFIKQQGYDPTVIFIVTEMGEKKEMEISAGKEVEVLETIIKLK